ncbi:hypothetical protein LXL04_034153 [Taraxacum kok-saghyz]
MASPRLLQAMTGRTRPFCDFEDTTRQGEREEEKRARRKWRPCRKLDSDGDSPSPATIDLRRGALGSETLTKPSLGGCRHRPSNSRFSVSQPLPNPRRNPRGSALEFSRRRWIALHRPQPEEDVCGSAAKKETRKSFCRHQEFRRGLSPSGRGFLVVFSTSSGKL